MTRSRRPLRVCLYGLGAIGGATARALLGSPSVRIAGVIDTDPRKIGRDMFSLLRMKGTSGLKVSGDAERTLRTKRFDVVIHSTGSRLEQIAPQLEGIIEAGVPCVSSCEEMVFPDGADPAIARRLDRLARRNGVALLGAGVNPGFVMDLLVLALSGAVRDISHISVERVLDPLARRKAFRKKVGLGMNFKEASREVTAGRMGHVGLRQSALLVARGLGWDITQIDEDVRILCGDEAPMRRTRRPSRPDAPVRGLQQTLVARTGSRARVHMVMVMEAATEAPHDAIAISGEPDLRLWIQGGLPGDQATVSCLVNGMEHLLNPPRKGLLTLLELPLRTARGGNTARRS
jgi:hypothetical protein